MAQGDKEAALSAVLPSSEIGGTLLSIASGGQIVIVFGDALVAGSACWATVSTAASRRRPRCGTSPTRV